MTDLQDLKERVGRYTRLMENDDFIKTLDEVDIQFGLKQTVFHDIGAMKGSSAAELIIAKEAARAYSTTLRTLSEKYQAILEDAIQQQQQEKEGDE